MTMMTMTMTAYLQKLLDNDYDTKWEEEGFGSFIQADLGSVESVCNVGIAWDKGDERSYNFVISTSDDGTTFTDALRGTRQRIYRSVRDIRFK